VPDALLRPHIGKTGPMPFEREYAELAAVADAAGPESPTWTLGTSADRSLLFRLDIEQPFEATLSVGGEWRLWTLRLVIGPGDERAVRVGFGDDYHGVLRNVGLTLLEVGEELRDAGADGDFEFVVAALNWAISVDETPVIAAAAESLGRLLIAGGNVAEGVELLEEYAIPALEAIGQEKRAAELRTLART
jgi:hypothetical protein